MIFKIVYALRIIAACLIVLFVLDHFLKWNMGKSLIVIIALFLLVYVIMSMIAVFVRFRMISRPLPKTPPQEDEKVS
ncbi:MAG: hypothetical protein V1871_01315 [Planctomycetota bacterium]